MSKGSLFLRARARNFSIQIRALLYLLTLGILLSVLLTWRATLQQRSMIFEELQKRAVLMTNNLAQACVLPILLEDRDALQSLIEKYSKQEDVLYITLRDKQQNVLAEVSAPGTLHLELAVSVPEDSPVVVQETHALHVAGRILMERKKRADMAELLSGRGDSDPPAETQDIVSLGTVHVGLSTNATQQIARFLWQSAVGTTGILSLGGIIAFILFNRTIIKPLYSLVEATREVSRGNLNQQIEKLGNTIEFNLLASSFNKMVVDLKRVKDQLVNVNQELEGRVQERTLALETVNRDLSKANVHLKELIEVKSKFVSMVSHELRTPIASIKGFILTIQRYKDKLTPEKTDRYLQIIHDESLRLSRLIEELLDISRIQEGRLEIHSQQVDLNALVEKVMERYRLKTGRVKFVFRNDQSDGQAFADPDKVEQIVINLLDNALRFSPEGGAITVRMFHQNDSVVLEVLDEGPGIPTTDFEKIFEAFYRVDTEINTRNPGTGLGLAISRSLSESMGGHLWAGNREPRGACFAFILPRFAAAKAG
jgi:signal transduction histidine kinase